MGTATERRALPGKARARAFSPAARVDATSRTHADHATRIIGYLKRVSSWSGERRQEHERRAYQEVRESGASTATKEGAGT